MSHLVSYEAAERDLLVYGRGDRVILVPGGGDREGTWSDQMPLAASHRLELFRRRGYGDTETPPEERPSFEGDAAALSELLSKNAHVVGFSGGGPGTLLAAAANPSEVRSLTVIEPATLGLASGHPAADALISNLASIFSASSEMTPEEFDERFVAALGIPFKPPTLTPVNRARVQSLMRDQLPWGFDLPLAQLAEASFPKFKSRN